MKYIFIVNPTSGKGKALKISNNIEKICKQENIDYEIKYTKAQGDATNIAKEYFDEENILYSVGGDGNVSEILNGIIGSKNMLGIIPAGSGNDFYKTLKKEDEEIKTIDIGKINDKYFINIACIGIDADVANNISLMKKKHIPVSQLYNASLIYTFFKYKFKKLKFNINNNEHNGEYTILTICNGQYYGGGYRISTRAKLNDGLLDIYFVKKISKIKIPGFVIKLKKEKHESLEIFNIEKSKSITISSKDEIACNVDGETILDNKFEIDIIPNAIKIYNNKELTNKFLKLR